ncbi:MAG: phenylalanine--tRNA ligase subunit beta [Coriobacteriia bacterium]|nr:phenylalanine--tRNA ligase subunit beta [Coriobacteriia bacterium]
MLVPLEWLRELVRVDVPLEELVDRLDMTGTKVEAVHVTGEYLEGVLVGRVLSCGPHLRADRLSYCEVDVGTGDPLHIVCGATNFAEGDLVPVAPAGTTLPGGVSVKRAKLRGVESEGMMCSAPELGLPGEASGLLILPPDAPVGADLSEYLGTRRGVVELEITPNRPDCLSIAGVAREIGAVLGVPAQWPASVPEESGDPAEKAVGVTIEDGALCPRYAARLIRGVKVGPSPKWLADRVLAAGARPINNVVDVTNYVMFELGQPLHAFDAGTIGRSGGRAAIVVRRAREGERLTTLDGQDRALSPETLVIADPEGAVALAGVMGGSETEVTEGTSDVLLESAAFKPASVGRTSRSLGLISEASLRFERGVDPNGCAAAADRAAALIAEVADGEVAPGVVDAYPAVAMPLELPLRLPRLKVVLGVDIPGDEVASVLGRLGMGVVAEGETLRVTVPTYRPDVEREIDLVEEVVRVWGMERVPGTLPTGRGHVGGLSDEQTWRRRITFAMRAAGLNETMTYAFTSAEDLGRLRMALGPGEVPVAITNPMSAEQAVMRTTLLGNLLRSVSYNQRRGVEDVQLFEIGRVFVTAEGRKLPKERETLGAVLAGRWNPPSWNDPAVPLDFFDGKGVIATLAEELGVRRRRFRAPEGVVELPWLQPGRAAHVVADGDVVGWLGEVHPEVLAAFQAAAPVVALELSVPQLLKVATRSRTYGEIPRYPGVMLDIALVVPVEVTAERIEKAILSAGGDLLRSARLFDVYTGAGVPKGRKSVAFSLTYQATDRTLTDDEVRPLHDKVVRKVSAAVGGELRG